MAARGCLRGVSPIARLLVLLLQITPVLLSFDPHTPLLFLVLSLAQLLFLDGIPPGKMLRVILPLSSLPAGLFLLNFLFSETAEAGSLFFFSLPITNLGLYRGLVVGLRSLALLVPSVGYLLATNPLDLVNALMQQTSLSPRVGFGLYVAWNTIPFLRADLRRIEQTHRIRLRGRKRRLRDTIPTAVTLLSGAIRHAERASLSMTARGLEGAERRSFIREAQWRGRDWVFLIASAIVVATLWIVLWRHHLFVFGLG